ncbi:Asp-tRNA(Asn)/Glu-tRNA(Gln) amidotransferase subunit GatB [Candidatus Mycoplasma pogonae]
MSNKYDVVIGIEIHIELNTQSKMFSPARNSFDDKPNENVHPIDLGYPGTLPRINVAAVISAIKLAKALNMEIDTELHFDRKHYFYPDLPKGFQITQQFRPIGKNGILPVKVGNNLTEIAVERIHLEEDTAKQIHNAEGTFLNYNRAGIPLIEIVSRPVIHSAAEAAMYVDNIRKLALFLGISDAKLEEGSLRADANISLKLKNSDILGTKVEIKNINSINNVKKAIELEIASQTQILDNGDKVLQQTKRFDDQTQTNKIMREKTSAISYRYFPEPNIPVMQLNAEFLETIAMPVLPWDKEKEYQEHNIHHAHIDSLINNIDYYNYFEKITFANKSKAANFFFAEIIPLVNQNIINLNENFITPEHISEILELLDAGKISQKQAKQLVKLIIEEQLSIQEIIKKHKIEQVSDENVLKELITNLINENQTLLNEYQQRPERVIKFFLGSIMKLTKGNANPQSANKILVAAIENWFEKN